MIGRIGSDRHPQFRAGGKIETMRHHTGDREWRAIQLNGFPEHRTIRVESRAPDAVADHDRIHFIAAEDAAQRWLHAERRPETRGDALRTTAAGSPAPSMVSRAPVNAATCSSVRD